MSVPSHGLAPCDKPSSLPPSRSAWLGLLCLLWLGSTGLSAHAQTGRVFRNPEVSSPSVPAIWQGDLRTLPSAPRWQPGDSIKDIPRRGGTEQLPPLTGDLPGVDPLVAAQRAFRAGSGARAFTTPIHNFEGQGFNGITVPDTVGAVGRDYYCQIINNSTFVFYHKQTGAVAAGPIRFDSLSGGLCSSGNGDPVVIYDYLANRWIMAEFAETDHLCFLISRTENPITGGWYAYTFATPNFPDYFKFGLWSDAYYLGANEAQASVYALDRHRMLNGEPATFQRFTVPGLPGHRNFDQFAPAVVDGVPPENGLPGLFLRHKDDETHTATPDPNMDFYEIWEFSVDWDIPANSSFSGPIDVVATEYNNRLCPLIRNCVQQPSGPELDAIPEVLMWRVQYRNHGSHESMVGNLVVNADGDRQTGIRWFELRRPSGGAWTVHQEGTYAPDTANRWMGSLAMDQSGNLALAYNVTDNTALFPSLRYAGRLADDPLGVLTTAETELVAGAAGNLSSRYGDYAAMAIDPVDDCTFWFTGTYNPTSSWGTRIAAFRFDDCGTACAGSDLTIVQASEGTICPGGSLAVSTQVSGGQGPYQYRWSPGSGLDDPTAASPTATPTRSTTYALTVTDANGCVAQRAVYIVVTSTDINPLLENWRTDRPAGDLNLDGIVSVTDFVFALDSCSGPRS